MTGIEKAGAMMLSAAGLGAVQTPLPGNWVNANWPILVTIVAVAVAWGTLGQRMRTVEKKVDELASKEAIHALDEKMTTLVGMLNQRIADRRHPHE